MRFLADDLLEGRAAGKRGEAIAGLYIAAEFERLGLLPGGESGSYWQTVPLKSTQLNLGETRFSVITPEGEKSYAIGEEIATFAHPSAPLIDLEAELVFAGHGIVASEFDIDDYAGLDVDGKIVVVLGGAPSVLPSAEAAHFGSGNEKRRTAAARGAVGYISIYTPAQEARFPFANIGPFINRSALTRQDQAEDLPELWSVLITQEASADLFDDTGQDVAALVEAGRGQPVGGFALPARASYHLGHRL